MVYCVQHQPARAMPVHQVPGGQSGKQQPATERAGEDWDDEQRSAANREYGPPAPGGRTQVPRSSRMMVQARAMEVNSTHQGEEEKRQEASSRQQGETFRPQRQELDRYFVKGKE